MLSSKWILLKQKYPLSGWCSILKECIKKSLKLNVLETEWRFKYGFRTRCSKMNIKSNFKIQLDTWHKISEQFYAAIFIVSTWYIHNICHTHIAKALTLSLSLSLSIYNFFILIFNFTITHPRRLIILQSLTSLLPAFTTLLQFYTILYCNIFVNFLDSTECIYLSYILTLLCYIVLIFRWRSKTTDTCSYTKVRIVVVFDGLDMICLL